MTNKRKPFNGKDCNLSAVSSAFLENNTFLKKYLARFLSELQDIEDVVQETYLRAYKAESRKAIDQPKAFLFRIARNLALTELTKKSHQITDFLEDITLSAVTEAGASVEDEIEARQNLGIYCEAVAVLPERTRRVYLLRKVHGLPHKEIAQRLELSVSSVEKHLKKGMLFCRDYVRKREGLRPELRVTENPTPISWKAVTNGQCS